METIERYQPDIKQGLTTEQINHRKEQNLVNQDKSVPTKSIKSILKTNFFTLFNLINLCLALAIFAVEEYRNMLFILLVIINTAISTIQEIHAKHIIDKLSLISATKVHSIREGKQQEIGINDIVLDDILAFKTGNQIITDCILEEGEIEVNESLITGEADPIIKRKGDMIYSGSYVISGNCVAKVEHISEDNLTSQIAKETKYIKTVKSEIMTALNKIIAVVSIAIIPIGALLFWNQFTLDGGNIVDAVVHTVAAIIGMIPEGLILLTSTVLAVSSIRLSKRRVLVQELFCIETLARVDTLCLDKTGTITEGKMEVSKIVPIHITQEEMKDILWQIGKASEDGNSTIEAIREEFGMTAQTTKINKWKASEKIAFSSEKKWSGITFEGKGSYIIGAPEFILKENLVTLEETLKPYTSEYRVILLAHTNQKMDNHELPEQIESLGLICMTDKIRENAKETLDYFKKQGVDIRIISGDNPVTVSKIAKRAGVEGHEKYIDCTNLTEEDIRKASKEYKIFGRVSPIQKKQLVRALKEEGHTVAMTGDGVNDIIALKEADCSIAMAEGSDAARNVSQLVLLNSNFEAMPQIVAEGRRTINNLERSATLFLSKTVYSSILAILFVFINSAYPFMPIQLSLISLVCIGIPSFILALEPNKNRVKGNFMKNILAKSLPASLTVIITIIMVLIVNQFYPLPEEIYSSICVVLTALIGFLLIIKISKPFNLLRGILLPVLVAIFATCLLTLKNLFAVEITQEYVGITLMLGGMVTILFFLLNQLTKIIDKKRRSDIIRKNKRSYHGRNR